METISLTGLELAQKLHKKEVSCTEVVKSCLAEIRRTDGTIKAQLSLMEDSALALAQAQDQRIQNGDIASPLAGVPIAIKDNICVEGTITSCASKMLEKYRAPYHATVVQKLLKAGLIPVSKANLDEFAMGSSCENSAFFPTKNPWNLDCVPGGSSGGSAATVAAHQVPLSLGSDTGGSIRQPAAFCGIVGVKPTYGRVSRFGLVAFASSLDQIGPFSRTVADAAALLGIISGFDEKDSTTVKQEIPDFVASLNDPVEGLKIGVPQELLGESINQEVKDALFGALDAFGSLGVAWDKLTLPSFSAAVSTYYVLASAEASANLARFDGVRYGYRTPHASTLKEMISKSRGEGFGPEVQRRIVIGTYVLSSGYYDAYYGKAQKARSLMIKDFEAAFAKFDVIVTPTTPTVAFKIGENVSDPLAMYLADIATIPVNLAGLPAISIPCGFDSQGMPIGMQLIGKAWDEKTLFKLGYAYQKMTTYHLQRPKSLEVL